MEGISKKTVATSPLLRFLVGLEQQEFTIHSALLAHQSPALGILVNDRLKEAADGTVLWDDVDEHTFTSFWQYAYTGSYETPRLGSRVVTKAKTNGETKPGREPVDARPVEDSGRQSPEGVGSGAPPTSVLALRKKKARNSNRDALWTSFCSSWKVDLPAHVISTPHEHKGLDDNAETFIHHVNVYLLADRYGIPRLMDVSFSKLHKALIRYAAQEAKLHDIVALLRYCYGDPVPGRLRDLVVRYAACEIEQLWKSEDFRNFLEATGSFSRALMGSIVSRLD
ncbi:uncharacterized protein DNG_09247 [Cephalotrichum gorgonifer]|uniref:BTB domain-containing protein n=1 Tax=Cephalotrichum gorgonifer TaxID=2041049 RepID=A0AAE8SZY8_9PEZI|nr:uncharacterized protein DNG_09247 [Cephalotrichum gorgonifer]